MMNYLGVCITIIITTSVICMYLLSPICGVTDLDQYKYTVRVLFPFSFLFSFLSLLWIWGKFGSLVSRLCVCIARTYSASYIGASALSLCPCRCTTTYCEIDRRTWLTKPNIFWD